MFQLVYSIEIFHFCIMHVIYTWYSIHLYDWQNSHLLFAFLYTFDWNELQLNTAQPALACLVTSDINEPEVALMMNACVHSGNDTVELPNWQYHLIGIYQTNKELGRHFLLCIDKERERDRFASVGETIIFVQSMRQTADCRQKMYKFHLRYLNTYKLWCDEITRMNSVLFTNPDNIPFFSSCARFERNVATTATTERKKNRIIYNTFLKFNKF